jgi:DNA invertase Pin-like site-specific DNA recombinase
MLLSWVAQFERQRLRERTRAGLEAAEKKGRKGGRPRADEKALEAARREVGQVSLLTGKVEGLRAVAKRHGLSAATLSRHLRAVASSSSADASRLPGPDE